MFETHPVTLAGVIPQYHLRMRYFVDNKSLNENKVVIVEVGEREEIFLGSRYSQIHISLACAALNGGAVLIGKSDSVIDDDVRAMLKNSLYPKPTRAGH